jgi:hypothetical protein
MMGIVMHTMVGNLRPGTVATFNNPAPAAAPTTKPGTRLSMPTTAILRTRSPTPRSPHRSSWLEVLGRLAGFSLQVTDSVTVQSYGTHVMGGDAWGGHTCPGPGPRAGQRAEISARAQANRGGRAGGTSDGTLSLAALAAQHQDRAVSNLAHDGDS